MQSSEGTLYRAYGDSLISHLGNAAYMYVSIAWTRLVENVEVGMGGIILVPEVKKIDNKSSKIQRPF